MKKKISVVIPCFNEEGNIENIANQIINIFNSSLSSYDYEIIFIDNNSYDNSRSIIRELCKKNNNIKAIFNIKNFGQFNSPYYGLLQSTGDASILIACDFQEPVHLIKDFVNAWEEGYLIAIGTKSKSFENIFLRSMKQVYYHLIKKFSTVEQIKMFTGFELYDKKFLDILRQIEDLTPFLRGMVAEYGYRYKEFKYEQGIRQKGKTSNNFYTLYDGAMLSFTSYTKIGLRIAIFIGMITMIVSFLIGLIYFIMKIIWWDRFSAGMIPMLLGMLFLGSVQIFFIGMIGEYVLSINQRTMRHPIVIEKERINFIEK